MHHDTKESCINALQLGCYMCSRLFYRFTGNHPQLRIPDVRGMDVAANRVLYHDSVHSGDNGTGCLEISFLAAESQLLERMSQWGSGISTQGIAYRKFRLVPENLIEPYLNTRQLSPRTNTDAAFDQMSSWLKQCVNNHIACPSHNGFTPTRLLDVTPDGLPSQQVRLVSSQDLGDDHPPYLTLSHRWHSNEIFKLRMENAANLSNGFDVNLLPQNFRHAINITRRFGERYLWIDALCIIQDSESDWQEEAAKMCDVYGNSFCNIAATSVETDSNPSYRYEPYGPFPKVFSTWTNAENDTWYIIDSGFWEFDWSLYPSNSRGWIVQERALSPRTLYIHKQLLIWQCHDLTACDTFPRGFPDTSIVGQVLEGRLLSSHGNQIKTWMNVVRKYSQAQLTFDGDKLIAIGGVAQHMASAIDAQYLAGIWRQDMISQLLWKVDYARQSNGHMSTYANPDETPSWSWASINGTISYPAIGYFRHFHHELVTVTEAVVDLVTDNVYGQVRGGFLRLQSSCESRKGSLYTQPVDSEGKSLMTIHAAIRVVGEPWKRAVYPDILGYRIGEILPDHLLYLPMLSISRQALDVEGKSAGDSEIFGLCLCPVPDRRGVYKRYGLFNGKTEEVTSFFADEKNQVANGLYIDEENLMVVVM